eukprot:scaffold21757_cov64-Phaeocystis_antarctica.AAC.2
MHEPVSALPRLLATLHRLHLPRGLALLHLLTRVIAALHRLDLLRRSILSRAHRASGETSIANGGEEERTHLPTRPRHSPGTHDVGRRAAPCRAFRRREATLTFCGPAFSSRGSASWRRHDYPPRPDSVVHDEAPASRGPSAVAQACGRLRR